MLFLDKQNSNKVRNPQNGPPQLGILSKINCCVRGTGS